MTSVAATFDDARPRWSWGLVPTLILVLASIPLFPLRLLIPGYVMVALALALAIVLERRGLVESAAGAVEGRPASLTRDLSLIALGMVIVSTMSVKADISWGNFFLLGVVLAAAVAGPYLVSRFVYRDRAISFPWRGTWPWNRVQWLYLVLVVAAAWLILPFYFISSGVYQNWPVVVEWHEIGRLFVGVNAVGTWDELFFICTVFVLLRRHFVLWQANILQAIVFVAFLWELGYQSWGPLLTIPFALLQGWIFNKTHSLPYVLTLHLLFDVIVFGVIVHAGNPELFDVFLVSAR